MKELTFTSKDTIEHVITNGNQVEIGLLRSELQHEIDLAHSNLSHFEFFLVQHDHLKNCTICKAEKQELGQVKVVNKKTDGKLKLLPHEKICTCGHSKKFHKRDGCNYRYPVRFGSKKDFSDSRGYCCCVQFDWETTVKKERE